MVAIHIDIIAKHVAGRARETQNLCKLRDTEGKIVVGQHLYTHYFIDYRVLCAGTTLIVSFAVHKSTVIHAFGLKFHFWLFFRFLKRNVVFSNERNAYTSARRWRPRYTYMSKFCYYIYAFAVSFPASVHTLFTLLTLNILFLLLRPPLLLLLLLIFAIWTCAQLLYAKVNNRECVSHGTWHIGVVAFCANTQTRNRNPAEQKAEKKIYRFC